MNIEVTRRWMLLCQLRPNCPDIQSSFKPSCQFKTVTVSVTGNDVS